MNPSPFEVRVTNPPYSVWYMHYIGRTFTVVEDRVCVRNHVWKLSCYRVVGGPHDGDCISKHHAAPVGFVSESDHGSFFEGAE